MSHAFPARYGTDAYDDGRGTVDARAGGAFVVRAVDDDGGDAGYDGEPETPRATKAAAPRPPPKPKRKKEPARMATRRAGATATLNATAFVDGLAGDGVAFDVVFRACGEGEMEVAAQDAGNTVCVDCAPDESTGAAATTPRSASTTARRATPSSAATSPRSTPRLRRGKDRVRRGAAAREGVGSFPGTLNSKLIN